MSENRYAPVAGGSVQSSYYDQMPTALAGDLYSASDVDLVDSAIVQDAGADGLPAGRAVVISASADPARPGINAQLVTLAPDHATVIHGITVRNQQMQSNNSGQAVWFDGRECNILRLNRIGGRIWVELASGTAVVGAQVYMLADDTGRFTSLAAGGANLLVPGLLFASAGTGVVLVEAGVLAASAFQPITVGAGLSGAGSIGDPVVLDLHVGTGLSGSGAHGDPVVIASTVVTESDVVNTLVSTSTTAPLSAAQGKALKDALDAHVGG